MSLLTPTPHRRRRTHSPECKVAVVTTRRQTGASVAAVARQHDLNDNLVHKWLRKAGPSCPTSSQLSVPMPTLTEAGTVPASRLLPIHLTQVPPPDSGMIRLQFRQAGKELCVDWPAGERETCLSCSDCISQRCRHHSNTQEWAAMEGEHVWHQSM